MYYGIDMGGSNLVWAVFDEQGTELARLVSATPPTYEAVRQLILSWVQAADAQWQIKGQLGIGFPGVCDANGRILAANVPSIHGQYLVQDLTLDLSRPVFADNDAHCFLLSEAYGGAAEGAELALALTLGTGVGGALVHQGRVLNSRRGSSSEFGHGAIAADLLARYPSLPLFPCGCGRVGCIETYVSGTGLANLYQHVRYGHHPGANARLAGPAIIRAWQQGEVAAGECVDLYVDILASALANLMTQLDPDVVVLGGGLGEQTWLYEPLNQQLCRYLMQGVSAAPVVAAHFGGSGGVRGAALLAKCVV